MLPQQPKAFGLAVTVSERSPIRVGLCVYHAIITVSWWGHPGRAGEYDVSFYMTCG